MMRIVSVMTALVDVAVGMKAKAIMEKYPVTEASAKYRVNQGKK